METARAHAFPGLFLVLDGPDGGGKTTQAARLTAWLRSLGHEVVACRDPGGTALGDRLRALLMDRDSVPVSIRSEMLMFNASRAQLVADVIAPALAAGKTVVSDRFVLASIVYQGTAAGLMEEEVAMVGLVATAGLLPDLTLVLDIEPAAAQERIGCGRDRIEDRPLFYRERVRAGYLAAAELAASAPAEPDLVVAGAGCPYYPAPIALIDAAADPDQVFDRIQHEVSRVVSVRSRS